MNVVPLKLSMSNNSPVSSGGNVLTGTKNTQQASEFNSILSESLMFENSPAIKPELLQAAQRQIALPLESGQELPQTGESLPSPDPTLVSADSMAENVLLASAPVLGTGETKTQPIDLTGVLNRDGSALLSEQTTGIAAQQSNLVLPATNQTDLDNVVEPISGIEAQALNVSITKQQQQVSVAGVQSSEALAMSSIPGVIIANGASNVEGSRIKQEAQLRNTTPGIVKNTQTVIPQQFISSPIQPPTPLTESSLVEQAPGLFLPEKSAAIFTDKIDFSRILEKGISVINKDSVPTQIIPLVDTTTKSSLEGLKTAVESLQMQQSIDKPKWSNEFASRMVWLTKEGIQSAQLKLTPAHLGTIEIKITVQNDQASVSFISQNGAVRDAIESSLPRLREMMQEAGVKLEQANVSTNSNNASTQQQADKTPTYHSHGEGAPLEGDEEFPTDMPDTMAHEADISRIDFYA